MNRKSFLRNSSLAALALAANPTTTTLAAGSPLKTPQKSLADTPLHFAGPKVRLALIGTGLRGQGHLGLLLRRDDVDIVAICDIDDHMLTSSKNAIAKSGKKMPQVYTGSPYAWQDLLKKEQLDGVIIATPWEWHKPMIVGSLEAGIKYVATEVILGITLQDHWDVVKAAEKSQAQKRVNRAVGTAVLS